MTIDTTLANGHDKQTKVKAAKIGPWVRPDDTGSTFAHLPMGMRSTATPLLLHRLKQFDIPLPKGRPVYDRIYVYPLEGKDQGDRFEGSVLFKAEQSKDLYGASRGIIVKAGIKALEHMWSHGVELGHMVIVARLSPWERKYEGKGRIHKVMVLRSSEIVSSEDLEEDVLAGCLDFEYASDGQLVFKDRPRTDPDETDEGI
jgi:hypothetical protein